MNAGCISITEIDPISSALESKIYKNKSISPSFSILKIKKQIQIMKKIKMKTEKIKNM